MPIQDISEEELKEMGFKKFRVSDDGTIHPDDMEAFLEYDRCPLTEEEKKFLRECLEIYEKNPVCGSASKGEQK